MGQTRAGPLPARHHYTTYYAILANCCLEEMWSQYSQLYRVIYLFVHSFLQIPCTQGVRLEKEQPGYELVPRHKLTGSWTGKGTARTWTGTHMTCCHCKQKLLPPRDSTSPRFSILAVREIVLFPHFDFTKKRGLPVATGFSQVASTLRQEPGSVACLWDPVILRF